MSSSTKSESGLGLYAFGIVSTVTVALCTATASFILPAFRKFCLPFVPATNAQVKNVIKALHSPKKHGMTLVDIGSGDGRIAITAGKYGFHATGYELNIWLVLYSKFKAYKSGQLYRTRFQRMDLWKANYTQFDNVVIFGVEEMMPHLEQKLLREMQKGSKLIACRFPFPSLTPSYIYGSGVDTVWSYEL